MKRGCGFKCRINFEIQVTLTVFPLKCIISVGVQFPPLHSFLLSPFGSQCRGMYPTPAVLVRLYYIVSSPRCALPVEPGAGVIGQSVALALRGQAEAVLPDGFLLPRLLLCPLRFSSHPCNSFSAAVLMCACACAPCLHLRYSSASDHLGQ